MVPVAGRCDKCIECPTVIVDLTAVFRVAEGVLTSITH